jgi:Tol biopolymer transport system component
VQAGSRLELTFSRPMDNQSVIERLSLQPAVRGATAWQGNTLVFTPEQAWPGDQTLRVTLKPGARAAGWLALPMRHGAAWDFTTRAPLVVYLFPSDAASNLYWLDPASEAGRSLTELPNGILDFSVTADGNWLYFSLANGQGGSDIYRLNLQDYSFEAGTESPAAPERVLVLECGNVRCMSAQVAPNGQWLAFEKIGVLGSDTPTYPQVWLLDLRAGGQAALALPGEHQTLQPAWSANGWLAFYDTNLPGFVYMQPGSAQSGQFDNQTGWNGTWAPDGSAFTAPEIFNLDAGDETLSGVEQFANSRLLRYLQADGSASDLTGADDLSDSAPAISPDGGLLAFQRKYLDPRRWTPGGQLWLMQPDGQQARPVGGDPLYNHFAFAWSPAGDHLAYMRANQAVPTQLPEIWLLQVASGATRKLITGGYAPLWIP